MMCIVCDVVVWLYVYCVLQCFVVVLLYDWFYVLLLSDVDNDVLCCFVVIVCQLFVELFVDEVVLYGDIYYDNILYFGDCGWCVIDLKGLCGECMFDYVNLFCNFVYDIVVDFVCFGWCVVVVVDVV